MLTSSQPNSAFVKDTVVACTVKDVKAPSGKQSKSQSGELLIGDENEPFEKLHQRLVDQIKDLANRTTTMNMEELNKNPNMVARLITNEFFFFTKKPLTIEEFQKLVQSIVNLAKEIPDTIHLILGSFAVLREDGVVMNVTPYIQCGKDPKLNLIVKNYPSEIDPIYNNEQGPLPNATKDKPETGILSKQVDVSDASIKIDGKIYPFSYNNIIPCKTKENNPFISCVDICKDHGFQVARTNLFDYYSALFDKSQDAKLDKGQDSKSHDPPFLINHVVTSNSIRLDAESCLSEKVTHADPIFLNCDKSSLTIEDGEERVDDVEFGTSFYLRPKEPVLLSNVCSEVFQHFALFNKKCVMPFLDKMKETKDFNINMQDKSGYTPLVVALLQNDFNLIKKLIVEFKADCKLAVEFCLKRKNLALFQMGLQFSEFRNGVNLLTLAQSGAKAMLCEAMAAGIEYKDDLKTLETLQSEESRDMILHFMKMKDLVKTMAPFELKGATKEDALKNFFLGNTSLAMFEPGLRDKEERVVDGLLGNRPEFILKETIKRELMDPAPDKVFLQKLCYVQQNLLQILSPALNNDLKKSPPVS